MPPQAVSGVRETLETNIRMSNGIPSTGEAPTSALFSQLAGSRGRRVGRRDDGVGERLETGLRGDTPLSTKCEDTGNKVTPRTKSPVFLSG